MFVYMPVCQIIQFQSIMLKLDKFVADHTRTNGCSYASVASVRL